MVDAIHGVNKLFFFVGVVVFIHTKIKNSIKISDLVVFLPDSKFQV